MNMKFLIIFFVYTFVSNIIITHGLDVIDLATGFNKNGVVAAFGDINSDKLVDIYIISPLGRQFTLVLSHLGRLVTGK